MRLFVLISLYIHSTTPLENINSPFDSRESVESAGSSGPNRNPRIIGGIPARAGQFPFAAVIRVATLDSNIFCGGALISNQWVITSAHCVDGAVGIEVRLGSNSLTEDDFNRVVLSSTSYFLHPEFNKTSLENDISLIKFRDKIEYSDYVGKIYLPVTSYSEGINVTAIGWGQTNDSDPTYDDKLNCATLFTISNDDCEAYYGNQITSDMICVAGQYNEGICTGDSGNPLVYLLNNRHPIIVGVASFFSQLGCATFQPSAYTRVFPYKDWILNTTGTLE